MSARSQKATMHELRLRRLVEHNIRMRDDLARPRIHVSAASMSLITFCQSTKDPLIPAVWGTTPKAENPYAPIDQGNCCTVM